MELTTRTLPAQKHIALVATRSLQKMLMSWVERHQPLLEKTFCMQQEQQET